MDKGFTFTYSQKKSIDVRSGIHVGYLIMPQLSLTNIVNYFINVNRKILRLITGFYSIHSKITTTHKNCMALKSTDWGGLRQDS